MRSTKDRVRHAISFEILGLLIVTPLGSLLFGIPMHEIGIVAFVSATIATGWNFVYNLLFDRAMMRLAGHVRKSPALRVGHALLFEAGLLTILLPYIAWSLNVSLGEAFMMDISFALFYVVYAFVFNWAYDVVFPLPQREAS